MEQEIPKLDYTIESAEERNELVKKICELTPPEQLTPYYLEILTRYLVYPLDKEERKQRKVLTDNRLVTINKRETSYQGLAAKLENGEDGIYNMMSGGDKNIILDPKDPITQEDIDSIPELRALVEEIERIEKLKKAATGKKKYVLQHMLIAMRRDQYVIKLSANQPMYCTKLVKSANRLDLSENIYITDKGEVVSDGIITFYDPNHMSALLCNYQKLKDSSWGHFTGDMYYMMIDLDNLIDKTLKDNYPIYYDIFKCKAAGDQNVEIQAFIEEKYGVKHSIEYISSLWRNKIPKLLSEQAQEDYILWYYLNEKKGNYKKCSRCGQIKLVHPRFFSKNSTSKDGFYSICKECRSAKNKEKNK